MTITRAQLFIAVGLIVVSFFVNVVGLIGSLDRISSDLPEVHEDAEIVRSWGGASEGRQFCALVANGTRFLKYKDKYKLAGGCYAFDGLGNWMDAPQLQMSQAYDIEKGNVRTLLKWSPSFVQYRAENPRQYLYYVLLMLPDSLSPGAFNTVRQARAMGARVVFHGATVEP